MRTRTEFARIVLSMKGFATSDILRGKVSKNFPVTRDAGAIVGQEGVNKNERALKTKFRKYLLSSFPIMYCLYF